MEAHQRNALWTSLRIGAHYDVHYDRLIWDDGTFIYLMQAASGIVEDDLRNKENKSLLAGDEVCGYMLGKSIEDRRGLTYARGGQLIQQFCNSRSSQFYLCELPVPRQCKPKPIPRPRCDVENNPCPELFYPLFNGTHYNCFHLIRHKGWNWLECNKACWQVNRESRLAWINSYAENAALIEWAGSEDATEDGGPTTLTLGYFNDGHGKWVDMQGHELNIKKMEGINDNFEYFKEIRAVTREEVFNRWIEVSTAVVEKNGAKLGMWEATKKPQEHCVCRYRPSYENCISTNSDTEEL
ncbi:hypothetical protein AB6A40_005455 [Gnathostoma spinigerum]|uniref:C-type lectin domain-containing protein n=1 Tax=Gnathostoma spinigerum TaxID=75299 RepID=A0ABD6EMU0_9BILA